ncbi:hypothetical protein [Sphingopyxis sp. RIFCSPHIGHO2_12_FULL_65_19]|uniref:hypothetical protein n=1 Tax=Sphingopyxis sp. RIFCSPHIGHO2_12_FULL_65_19 TaxID=1802172 RepID=UPI0008CAAA71|nr:hypothetical protein [Sphingopyxis sp. RIFCSPHIGHO2_12_FULL_65_19]OHD08693.1 MAG: hypothetical protein A3E77_02160 [Sphingopyxis sp. RIFCSPHIGHO2_12_FULL_65_19]
MTRTIAGWKVPPAERDMLLERFEPRYAELVADHVTLRFGTAEDTPLPAAHAGEIVGEVDDGAGVQALVVRIGGTTDRGDGSHYHITWSLGPGREAKESNDVLAATKWQRVHPPIAIALAPARWTV